MPSNSRASLSDRLRGFADFGVAATRAAGWLVGLFVDTMAALCRDAVAISLFLLWAVNLTNTIGANAGSIRGIPDGHLGHDVFQCDHFSCTCHHSYFASIECGAVDAHIVDQAAVVAAKAVARRIIYAADDEVFSRGQVICPVAALLGNQRTIHYQFAEACL